jgi:hypothetical protein
VIKLHDAVCMSCGEELDFPEYALASEAGMATSRSRGAQA